MTVKVMLLANGKVGLAVSKYLVEQGEEITCLYLAGADPEYDAIIKKASRLPDSQVYSEKVLGEIEHLELLESLKVDLLITVYWPYLLRPEVFLKSKKTINFHPALLPINRGWYPHVHSIIDGTPTGVTLHSIDENADTGDIWVQKEVPLSRYDTALSIYTRLQREMFLLFTDNWFDIKNDKIALKKQDNSIANYHGKNELDDLDLIDLEKRYSTRDLINLLRARSFGNKGFAYYYENGERVFLNIRLSDSHNFED